MRLSILSLAVVLFSACADRKDNDDDGYRAKDLPANLLQAQRDYFGAHTFRIKPEYANETYKEGQDIHVNWTGRGGNVSASTYNA